jgi:hypothetical protein
MNMSDTDGEKDADQISLEYAEKILMVSGDRSVKKSGFQRASGKVKNMFTNKDDYKTIDDASDEEYHWDSLVIPKGGDTAGRPSEAVTEAKEYFEDEEEHFKEVRKQEIYGEVRKGIPERRDDSAQVGLNPHTGEEEASHEEHTEKKSGWQKARRKLGKARDKITGKDKYEIVDDDLSEKDAKKIDWTSKKPLAKIKESVEENFKKVQSSFQALRDLVGSEDVDLIYDAVEKFYSSITGLKELISGVHELSEAGLHVASSAATAIPVVGAVGSVLSLGLDAGDLLTIAGHFKGQSKIRKSFKESGEQGTITPAQQTLDAALHCFKTIDKQKWSITMGQIAGDLTTLAGHLVSAGGISAVVGAPISITGLLGKLGLSVTDTAKDYGRIHKAYKIEKEYEARAEMDRDAIDDGGAAQIIAHNPKYAAQAVIDMAMKEGKEGDAWKILESFFVGKKGHLSKDKLDDYDMDENATDKFETCREIREEMLKQLGRDEDSLPILQEMSKSFEKTKDAVNIVENVRSYSDLKRAKDLLTYAGERHRSDLWTAKETMSFKNPEEKKAELLEVLLQEMSPEELELDFVREAINYLQPRSRGLEYERL